MKGRNFPFLKLIEEFYFYAEFYVAVLEKMCFKHNATNGVHILWPREPGSPEEHSNRFENLRKNDINEVFSRRIRCVEYEVQTKEFSSIPHWKLFRVRGAQGDCLSCPIAITFFCSPGADQGTSLGSL